MRLELPIGGVGVRVCGLGATICGVDAGVFVADEAACPLNVNLNLLPLGAVLPAESWDSECCLLATGSPLPLPAAPEAPICAAEAVRLVPAAVLPAAEGMFGTVLPGAPYAIGKAAGGVIILAADGGAWGGGGIAGRGVPLGVLAAGVPPRPFSLIFILPYALLSCPVALYRLQCCGALLRSGLCPTHKGRAGDGAPPLRRAERCLLALFYAHIRAL